MNGLGKSRPRWSASLLVVAVALVGIGPAWGAEITVQNDSITDFDSARIQAGFVAGESAAVWLDSPCDGNIVAVQVYWRSFTGLAPQSIEDSITIAEGDSFPVPGTVLELIDGPLMTDAVLNEFRYLNQELTIPLIVPVSNGQRFVVSFKFFNTPSASGPSVVDDVDGCQAGRNAIDAQGLGWWSACALGVTGDWVIRAVVECGALPGACCEVGGTCADGVTEAACTTAGGAYQGDSTTCATTVCEEACCFLPSGCVDMTVDMCTTASGFNQGPGTICAETECFPEGACCYPDGSCADPVTETDCLGAGGTFQGSGTECSGVTCPQPDGACCLSNGNCLVLSADDCSQIPDSTWAGALTDCEDADESGTADACEGGETCQNDGDCDDGDGCTADVCDPGSGEADPFGCVYTLLARPFGDVTDDNLPACPPGPGDEVSGCGELVDLADLVYVLNAFSEGTGWAVCYPRADLKPCGGDATVSLPDITGVMNAFGGTADCQSACPCP